MTLPIEQYPPVKMVDYTDGQFTPLIPQISCDQAAKLWHLLQEGNDPFEHAFLLITHLIYEGITHTTDCPALIPGSADQVKAHIWADYPPETPSP